MSESNSVFISYRRDVSAYIALAVFQDLHANCIDAFYDIETIKAGQFPTIIANQIAARPYFISILTPGTLDRCVNPDDWVRREIETAMRLQRLIIPLHTPEFSLTDLDKFLAADVAATLKTFNMVEVPHRYFKYAMQEVRSFLVPTRLEITPAPVEERKVVEAQLQQAAAEPVVTETQLTAQEYFERAQAIENIDEQIASYTEAIRLNPKFAPAYNNRGLAYNEKGDYDKAIQDFTEAFRLAPSPGAHINRIFAYISKGDYDKAIEDCTRAIRFDPRFAMAYASRGDAYVQKGEFDKALEDYTEAIRIDPYMTMAYVNRAFVYDSKGEHDKAIEDCNQVLKLAPDYALAYNNRGWAYYKKGEYDRAIEDCTKALQLDPKCIPAYDSRAYAYAAKRDYVNAVANAERALSALDANSQPALELRVELVKWRELM